MVQMAFIRLKTEHVKTQQEANDVFGRFQEMLRTGGILVKGTAVEETHHISGKKYFQIITTQEDGKNFEMMEWLLEQPEVHSTRTGDRDFYPEDYVADPAEQKGAKKIPLKKKKKTTKKKKKK